MFPLDTRDPLLRATDNAAWRREIERAVAAERERCAKCVPTKWLDPLLTGDGVARPPLNERGIEALLRGIQDRIRNQEA